MEEVGHHQEPFGEIENRAVIAAHRDQLVERVDRHELQAGRREDFFARDTSERLVHDAGRAGVAVVVRLAEQFAAFGEQDVVDSPGIDAHADRARAIGLRGFEQAVLNLAPEAEHVPAE